MAERRQEADPARRRLLRRQGWDNWPDTAPAMAAGGDPLQGADMGQVSLWRDGDDNDGTCGQV